MDTNRDNRERSWKPLRGSGPGEQVIPFAASVAALAAAVLLLPSAAWAGGVVTTCTEAALRAAMTGGGVVTFGCSGTIVLANTITNEADTVLDGTGHQITISGNNACGGFCVKSNVSFTLINLRIAKGRSDSGAGIYNAGGRLTVGKCVFVGNSAIGPDGSAYVPGSPGTNGCGGALFNTGVATITNSVFSTNSAVGGAGVMADSYTGKAGGAGGLGCGGAIYNSGSLSISSCSFAWNTAQGGGGSYGAEALPDLHPPGLGGAGGAADGGAVCNLGLLAVNGSTFLSNSVFGGQGGVGGYGGITHGAPITGAVGGTGGGGNGGALFNGGSASLINSTFALNSAVGATGGNGGMGSIPATIHYVAGSGGNGGMGGSGFGAICDTDGQVHLTNCTLAFNSGTGGSGGAGGPPGDSSRPPGANGAPGIAVGGLYTSGGQLINIVLATNVPSNGYGTITDAGHNLSSDGSCAFTSVGSLNNIDPKLGPLSDNGGPTLTMALLLGSPAIDAGGNETALSADQRGFPRPVGPAADIGAYELCYQTVLRITPPQAGLLNIRAYGTNGQVCRLLASTNFTSWVPIATNQIGASETVLFQDGCALGRACWYYRVQTP